MTAADRPLAQLRDWRRTLERDALARFAGVQSRLMEQERRQEDLLDWRSGYVAAEVDRGAGTLCSAATLRGARAFLDSLDDALAQQADIIGRLQRELEHCREQWRQASAELEVAQALLDQRRHARRKRALQVERRQLDDIAADSRRRLQQLQDAGPGRGRPQGDQP